MRSKWLKLLWLMGRLKFVLERQWPVIVNITVTYRHNMFYLYKDRENETGTDWVFPSLGTWEHSRQSSRPRYSHSHLQEDVSSICWVAQFLSGFVCCYINSSIVVIPSIILPLLWVCSPEGAGAMSCQLSVRLVVWHLPCQWGKLWKEI